MQKLSENKGIICPVCKTEIPDELEECPSCGLDKILIELEEGEDNDEYVENLEKLLADELDDDLLDLEDDLDELDLDDLDDESLDDILGLEESDDISELEESDDISELEESDDISGLEESDDISELEESDDISGLEESDDISELEESDDISELEESDDISELEESDDISELEESADISELEESVDISELEESADISGLEESDDISELEEEVEQDDLLLGLEDEVEDISEEELLKELEEELEVSDEVVYECPTCGHHLKEEDKKCSSCGTVFEDSEEELEDELSLLEQTLEDLAEDELEPTSEDEQEVIEIMEEIQRFIKDLEEEPIKLDVVRQLYEQVEGEKAKGNIESASRLGLEALKVCENMERFLDRSRTLKKELTFFKKVGLNYDHYVSELNSARRSVESGLTKKGLERVDKLIEKAESKKNNYEKLHDTKQNINDVVSNLNQILSSAKSLKMPLESERELISNALVASKDGDVQKALDWLLKARERSIDKIEDTISQNIRDFEEKVHELRADNRDKLEDMLMKVRDAKVEGNYIRAGKLIGRVNKLVEGTLKEDNGELDALKDLIDAAVSIGVDTTACIEHYQKAIDSMDPRRRKIHINNAKRHLTKRLPPKLQSAMKESLIKLEKARENEKNISKPVTYLKQANLNVKKKNYLKALEYIKVFNDKIRPMLEEEEEKEEVKEAGVLRIQKKLKKEPKPTKTIDLKKTKTIPRDLMKGSTYLFTETDPVEAFKMAKKKVDEGIRGICVTRQYPDKVKSRYNMRDVRIIWLSNIDQADAIKPKALDDLSLEMEDFLKDEGGLILLDGLEYLISNNDFKIVFHVIQSIKDQVAISDSILILTLTPDTLEKHQISLLEKEVDETYHL